MPVSLKFPHRSGASASVRSAMPGPIASVAVEPASSGPLTRPTEYACIEDLLAGELDRSVHIECFSGTTERAVREVGRLYAARRTAYYLVSDRGYDRETVGSYLRFFSRLAGGAVSAGDAMARFGLARVARTTVRRLTPEQVALLNFARMSLFEPEVCFCEHPLRDLGPGARETVLTWIGELTEVGCVFVTCGQPLRQALLLDGEAWWEGEDGRLFRAQVDEGDFSEAGRAVEAGGAAGEEVSVFAGDEVRICKIPAKAGAATLLFDPREIDFIEAMNKVNYVSVRGELYPTQLTMDELEAELGHSGFFRCHRSYIVNVQKVAKVERYTRNAFNLTLNDAAHTSIPLAKGRAEEMRERYGWR